MTNKEIALQLTLTFIDTTHIRKEEVYDTYSYFLSKLNKDYKEN